jgi:HSP20 family protein
MSTKWDPFRDLITLQDHLNRLFDASVAKHQHGEGLTGWHPPADVCETETEIHLFVEVAGMSPDAFDLRVENNRLILRGERSRVNQRGQAFHQTEILMGPFHRIFTLPSNVAAEGIGANYRDGILEIVLPKRKEPTGMTVPIKVK